ncbi:hypothetical protein R3W88_008027 [Solanum pinnatisectum]|uniref:Uncharacterized protein n=1 Tax=Solanum pinnatisectum TaxID=50273 RepID=A0AAV9M6U3_9SOLN|nr:hypothetical protein R3W88_008027 [Solanum pinnatisectum]
MNLNNATSRDDTNIDIDASIPVPTAGHSSQMDVVHPVETTTMREEADLRERRNWNDQHTKDQHTRIRSPENLSEEAQSSNFSFGIKDNSMNITPTPIYCSLNKSVMQNSDANTEAHLHNVVNEQISRVIESSKQVSNHSHKHKEGLKEQINETNREEKQVDFNRTIIEFTMIIRTTFLGSPITILGMILICCVIRKEKTMLITI